MTVNLGTCAHATAVTSLAPSLAMPPASYSFPTMKPVMFCRKTSGMRLVQAAPVDEAGEHLTHVVAARIVLRDDSVALPRVVERLLGREDIQRRLRLAPAEVGDDLAGERESVLVADGVVVRDAGDAGVDVRAAQLLRGHLLARGRLHERRPAEEDRARAPHDHGLVAHGGGGGAAPPAGAHDAGGLRGAPWGHTGLVEEK